VNTLSSEICAGKLADCTRTKEDGTEASSLDKPPNTNSKLSMEKAKDPARDIK